MIARTLSGSFICLTMLALFDVAALAQTSPKGVVTINGGRDTVLMKAPPQTFTAAATPSSKLVKIYSNLGTGSYVYNGSAGNGILGDNVPDQLYPEWVGCGFRPKADRTVTEIEVGATYVSGDNSLVMALNESKQDRPGKALHTWHFRNLPDFGTCCTLQTGKLSVGIPVKKGKLYWVTLRNEVQHQDTWDVWNFDISGAQGPWSNNIGSGWTKASYQQLNAFGVFGK
jgi:hypothetical protein